MGSSPVVKLLHLRFTRIPVSVLFGLIYSLPLLEDLAGLVRWKSDEM
jgi:hypothetical protein